MVKARHWTRPKPFQAEVSEKDLKLFEEDLSEDLQAGGEFQYFTFIFYLLLFLQKFFVNPFILPSTHTCGRFIHFIIPEESLFVFSIHGQPIGEHKTMFGEACLK
jgi:hypothetical protein